MPYLTFLRDLSHIRPYIYFINKTEICSVDSPVMSSSRKKIGYLSESPHLLLNIHTINDALYQEPDGR
jgi:hypothetical protein